MSVRGATTQPGWGEADASGSAVGTGALVRSGPTTSTG